MGSEFGRIMHKDLFFHFLDMEVKRARRYQNFLCLLLLSLKKCEGNGNGDGLKTCHHVLTDLLAVEMRESDLLGTLSEERLIALLPYADKTAGGLARTRFETILKYFDFKKKGYDVVIEEVCFPVNGADTTDLIKRALSDKTS
jgi:hypothetical protein